MRQYDIVKRMERMGKVCELYLSLPPSLPPSPPSLPHPTVVPLLHPLDLPPSHLLNPPPLLTQLSPLPPQSVGMLTGQAEPTIIQPPFYKKRFNAAMERYFMTIPDHFIKASFL